MRKIAILPTLLTLGNGICGFAAIALASRIGVPEFPEPADGILQAGRLAHFIGHDLRHARRPRGPAVAHGQQVRRRAGQPVRRDQLRHRPGLSAAEDGARLVAAAVARGGGRHRRPVHVVHLLRLARFNVDNTPDPASHRRFKGLPSPGAAGCLATLAIFRGSFVNNLAAYLPDIARDEIQANVQRSVELIAPLVALIVALLMVSRVPFPHVTSRCCADDATPII